MRRFRVLPDLSFGEDGFYLSKSMPFFSIKKCRKQGHEVPIKSWDLIEHRETQHEAQSARKVGKRLAGKLFALYNADGALSILDKSNSADRDHQSNKRRLSSKSAQTKLLSVVKADRKSRGRALRSITLPPEFYLNISGLRFFFFFFFFNGSLGSVMYLKI